MRDRKSKANRLIFVSDIGACLQLAIFEEHAPAKQQYLTIPWEEVEARAMTTKTRVVWEGTGTYISKKGWVDARFRLVCHGADGLILERSINKDATGVPIWLNAIPSRIFDFSEMLYGFVKERDEARDRVDALEKQARAREKTDEVADLAKSFFNSLSIAQLERLLECDLRPQQKAALTDLATVCQALASEGE